MNARTRFIRHRHGDQAPTTPQRNRRRSAAFTPQDLPANDDDHDTGPLTVDIGSDSNNSSVGRSVGRRTSRFGIHVTDRHRDSVWGSANEAEGSGKSQQHEPSGEEPIAVPSDNIPLELLELIRTFRRSVERAIVDGTPDTSQFGGTGPIGGAPPDALARGGGDLAIPHYVGAELNQTCNDLVRYVTQYVKHKRTEFEEAVLRHRHWAAGGRQADETGPFILTSLTGLLEGLIGTAACDRAILYQFNPATRRLVGIAYGGSQVPVAVPVEVSADPEVRRSNIGAPDVTLMHPAAFCFAQDAALNITSLRHCPPEIAIESYDANTGYTTHSTLCLPVCAPADTYARPLHRLDSTSEEGSPVEEERLQPRRPRTLGVLQLINKSRATPARDGAEVGGAAPFGPEDVEVAHHAALMLGVLMGYAGGEAIDFFSTPAQHLSVQTQRLGNVLRHHARQARKSRTQSGTSGGSVALTHTEDRTQRRIQFASEVAAQQSVRGKICGDILDVTEKTVAASVAPALRAQLRSAGVSASAGAVRAKADALVRRLTDRIFRASTLPSREGPLLIYTIGGRMVGGADDADDSAQQEPFAETPRGSASVVVAESAFGHLRGAWRETHAQLLTAAEQLKALRAELEAERQQRRVLESLCRRCGILTEGRMAAVLPSPTAAGRSVSPTAGPRTPRSNHRTLLEAQLSAIRTAHAPAIAAAEEGVQRATRLPR